MSTSRRVAERLAKLMALASSPNSHEAAAARAAAERIMGQYGLSESEAVGEVEGVTTSEVVLSGPEWAPAWKFIVVSAAAEACGAVAMSASRGRFQELRVMGEGDSARRAVELAGDMFAAVAEVERHMVAEVEVAARDPGVAAMLSECSGRRATRSFRVGAAYALARVVLEGRGAGRQVPMARPEDGVLVVRGGGATAREAASSKYSSSEVRRDFAMRDVSEVWSAYGYRLTVALSRWEGGRVVVSIPRARTSGEDPYKAA